MRYLIAACFLLAVSLLSFTHSTDFIVKGKVLDEHGKPLAGVTVMLKGTHIGTITSTDGSFSLSISKSKAVLQFMMVGYETIEQRVSDDGKPVSVKMVLSANRLDEVVIVGYEKSNKADYSASGAKRKIKSEPVVAPNNELSGKVAGLSVERKKLFGGHPPYQNKPADSWRYNNNYDREGYDAIVENRFQAVTDHPLSTFSIDVDAASYSNIRRMLNMGQLPPAGAVRIEEMINYFHYSYPQPENEDPFSINTEIATCPWNSHHKLVLIGLQGKKIDEERLPASNLVFLIDVSGSMQEPNKLPLVQQSMKLLVDQLREQDRVAIVVYAGNAGLVLASTPGSDKMRIKDAIDRLEAGGSTAGGAGIRLAYKVAKEHFARQGNNRVILCTDGDFNVGESSDDAMERLIEEERKSGIFLTVLGYGMGNYQDAKMQKLADKGNGNHAYIDNFSEAQKVLVSEFGGTLFTIAKDVKLQIEFNPARVQAYRLIGYENRILNKEDFNNDMKDAGELGSGHTVTALYEVIPVGVKNDFLEKVDKLKYQDQPAKAGKENTGELMTVKFRYKQPDQETSRLIVHPVVDASRLNDEGSENLRLAAAVAEFGILLRNSEFKQSSSYSNAWQLARSAIGDDREGYRSELLKLIRSAESLAMRNIRNKDEIISQRDY